MEATMKRRLWAVTNGIMLLMFVLSAAVQFNDPDPLAWICIYVAAAVACGLEIRGKTQLWLPASVAIIALLWAASLYTRASDVPIASLFAEWEMRDINVEEAREMYGLSIVAVWMIAIAIARSTLRASSPRSRGTDP